MSKYVWEMEDDRTGTITANSLWQAALAVQQCEGGTLRKDMHAGEVVAYRLIKYRDGKPYQSGRITFEARTTRGIEA